MYLPKVFISYSHDSPEHGDWILNFATILRNKGIDATLDQWDLQPGDDLPHFMEQQLDNADHILMICTENYVKKANNGEGGVGYEKMIITSTLLSKINSNKIIPIIRQNGTSICPTFLKTKMYINFSDDSEFVYKIDDLLRALLKSPLRKKPEIGKNPYSSNEEYQQFRNAGRVGNDFSGNLHDKDIQDYYYFKQLLKDVTNATQLHDLHEKFGNKFINM